MRAAVVDDPEHAPGRRVGLGGHDLLDEPPERLDPGLGLDAVEQVGVVDVPGGEVGERAAAAVFELDQRRAARTGRRRSSWRRPSACSWDFSSAQMTYSSGRSRLPSNTPRVEIQRAAGLPGEVRVAREDPRPGLPRLDRVVVQPAPDRRRRRVCHAALDHQPVQLSAREAAQRQAVRDRQLARDRLDLGDLLRGENGAGDPTAACPSTPPDDARRIFVATARPAPPMCPAGPRSRCRAGPRPHRARSARAAPPETAASPPARLAQAPRAPPR